MGGRLKLGQILVNRGILDPDQLSEALAAQQEGGARLGMTLVRLGFVDEETLIRTLAGQLKLPVARIRGKRVSPDVLECVPVELAEKHRCLPLFFKQEGGQRLLFLAMEDPSDDDALAAIAGASGETLRAVLVAPTELEEALQRHYHWASLTGEAPGWVSPEPSDATAAPARTDPHPSASGGEATGAGDDGDAAEDPGGELDLGAGLDADLGLDVDCEPPDEGDPRVDALAREPLRPLELAEVDTAPELPGEDFGEAIDSGAPGDADIEIDVDLDPQPEPLLPDVPALRPESLDPRIILRALSQLLVEKGVIGRDEFVQRLGELAAREDGRG